MKPKPCTRCHGSGVETDWAVFGANARNARELFGLSLRQVASAAGCSHAYISDLERGRRAWEGPKALAVSTFLAALAKKRVK